MKSFKSSLEEAFPGIYVHLVTLADDAASDQRAGFFGRVDEQVQMVCKQLSEVRELQGGFDAVGFSQGGECVVQCGQCQDDWDVCTWKSGDGCWDVFTICETR